MDQYADQLSRIEALLKHLVAKADFGPGSVDVPDSAKAPAFDLANTNGNWIPVYLEGVKPIRFNVAPGQKRVEVTLSESSRDEGTVYMAAKLKAADGRPLEVTVDGPVQRNAKLVEYIGRQAGGADWPYGPGVFVVEVAPQRPCFFRVQYNH